MKDNVQLICRHESIANQPLAYWYFQGRIITTKAGILCTTITATEIMNYCE